VGRYKYDETLDGITGASRYDADWTLLPSDTILCIYVDKNNQQWFGTPQGIPMYTVWDTREGWSAFSSADGLIHNEVHSIAEKNHGVMWFGTADGISTFDGELWDKHSTKDGLIHPFVNDLAFDSSGAIWIATEGGISVFDGSGWKSFSK